MICDTDDHHKAEMYCTITTLRWSPQGWNALHHNNHPQMITTKVQMQCAVITTLRWHSNQLHQVFTIDCKCVGNSLYNIINVVILSYLWCVCWYRIGGSRFLSKMLLSGSIIQWDLKNAGVPASTQCKIQYNWQLYDSD